MTRFSTFSDELPFIQCGNKEKVGSNQVIQFVTFLGWLKHDPFSQPFGNKFWSPLESPGNLWVFERNPTTVAAPTAPVSRRSHRPHRPGEGKKRVAGLPCSCTTRDGAKTLVHSGISTTNLNW